MLDARDQRVVIPQPLGHLRQADDISFLVPPDALRRALGRPVQPQHAQKLRTGQRRARPQAGKLRLEVVESAHRVGRRREREMFRLCRFREQRLHRLPLRAGLQCPRERRPRFGKRQAAQAFPQFIKSKFLK